MAGLGFFLVVSSTILLLISIQRATALHCWYCDNARDPFCGDRFDYSMVTEQVKNNNYHACLGQRCAKLVYDIDNDDDAHHVCNYLHQGARCETCSTDGCNGVAHLGPMALVTIIPVAIARLFSSHA